MSMDTAKPTLSHHIPHYPGSIVPSPDVETGMHRRALPAGSHDDSLTDDVLFAIADIGPQSPKLSSSPSTLMALTALVGPRAGGFPISTSPNTTPRKRSLSGDLGEFGIPYQLRRGDSNGCLSGGSPSSGSPPPPRLFGMNPNSHTYTQSGSGISTNTSSNNALGIMSST
ncbi:hypothetical protein SeMB42_g04559 [Synchytrium endobioticum]|uniref:Uncharacterized protein n=1 Tax=Synchytrium endobioticum TaxID=286115 RepID=A0A507CXK6_9FUNG|nr:hypothetical protein SeMB42_g04559 [Synchytrium endobioticum]